MATLNELNTLRTAAGMKPLKAWKESKAKLEAAIAKVEAAMRAKLAQSDVPANEEPTGDDLNAARVKTPVAKKATTKVVKPAKPAKNVEGVSISTIATKLGIDPKVARAKLRRQDEVPCIEGSQWLFKASDVSKIEAILKGDSRKK